MLKIFFKTRSDRSTQNERSMKLLAIAIILVTTAASCSKSTFIYDEGMCSYTGKYSPKKITQNEIQNTLDQLIRPSYIEAKSTAWELEDVAKLDLEALKAECTTRLSELQTLSFPDTENIVRLKESRIQELNETCEAKILTIIAYESPDTLMSFETEDEQINLFRTGLINGGDDLITAWREVVRIQKSRNGYPERIQAEFEEQFKSPEKMEYARLTVMMFGWWNHVNHLIYHTPEEYVIGQFESLFSKIEADCDY